MRKALIPFLCCFISFSAFAQSIYKYEDEAGITHYTSKRPAADAKPAKLPEIMRGDYKASLKKGFSCDTHGGINCQAGTDTDGSVVCFDGFKDASARFAFHCNSPKLIISDISELGGAGEFTVFVRNSRSVAAKAPRVDFHLPDDKIISLAGPKEIEPFGMAEFVYAPQPDVKVESKPKDVQLTLSCANCG